MKNYMNIFIFYAMLFYITNILATKNNYLHIGLRNLAIRFIILKKKNIPILVNKIKNMYNLCYEKSISSISEGVINYNQLSDEEKTLIETVISLAY